jgi:NAD(P)-dependent dehydrogenase (short-subunit alcohol dehydrogenase family)
MPLNKPLGDWQGKRVWLVGASTGIGFALGQALAARGAKLVISARNVDRLKTAAEQMGPCTPVPLDVSVATQWPTALEQTLAALGGLDVVIFNAGTYAPLRAWDLQLEGVRQTFETNLMGIYNGLAVCMPTYMAQKSGHIVIVSSVAGYGGLPKALAYGPSKAALINLAECLYLDLKPRGVGVTLVCPGFVETPLTAQNDFRMPALITAPRAAEYILQGMAAGRFEIHFPRRFSLFLKLLGALPRRTYFYLAGRLG